MWQLLVSEMPGVPWVDYHPWKPQSWINAGATGGLVTQVVLTLVGLTALGATKVWIIYAFLSGKRSITKRLTDPAPILEEAPAVPAPAGA